MAAPTYVDPLNATPSAPAAGLVPGVSAQATPYITQGQLTAQIEEATNALRSLIYQNESAPNSLPAAGGFTNEIALSNDIDQLNGTALNDVIINGASGLTAADVPPLSELSGLLGVGQGGTGTSTAPSANQLLLSDAAGNWEYVATSSLGISGGLTLTGTAGQVAYFSGTNTAVGTSSLFLSSSGNIGIGTTTPVTNFSVVGNGYFTGGLGVGVLNTTPGTFNGWLPRWGILPSNGGAPTSAGSGYAVGDSITMNAGCSTNPVVGVKAVSGGAIADYIVQIVGDCSSIPANPIPQLSTSGTGGGATFSLNWGPVAAALDVPSLSSGGGDLFIGGNLDSGALNPGEVAGGEDYGSENTFIGDRAGGRATSGSFNTALGHNAFGGGAGVPEIGTNDTALGTDAMRNSTSSASSVAVGASAMHDGGVEFYQCGHWLKRSLR